MHSFFVLDVKTHFERHHSSVSSLQEETPLDGLSDPLPQEGPSPSSGREELLWPTEDLSAPPVCSRQYCMCRVCPPSFSPSFSFFVAPPSSSALAQDLPVELRDPIRVHGSGQEVGEALVPPGPGAVPGAAILVEGHEVEGSSVTVAVEVGGVGVVPVLLKLLPEHTLSGEPCLQEVRGEQEILILISIQNNIRPLARVPPAGRHEGDSDRFRGDGRTHRSVQRPFTVHGQVEAAVHPPDADQAHGEADELQDPWTQQQHISTQVLD